MFSKTDIKKLVWIGVAVFVGTLLIKAYASFEQKFFDLIESQFVEQGLEPELADEYRYLYLLDGIRKVSIKYLESPSVEKWLREKAERRIGQLSLFPGEKFARERVIIKHLTYFSHLKPSLYPEQEKYDFLTKDIQQVLDSVLAEFSAIEDYDSASLQIAYGNALFVSFFLKVDDYLAANSALESLPDRAQAYPIIEAMLKSQLERTKAFAKPTSTMKYQLLPKALMEFSYTANRKLTVHKICDYEMISIYNKLYAYLPEIQALVQQAGGSRLFDSSIERAQAMFLPVSESC